jgi:hypothetical protein
MAVIDGPIARTAQTARTTPSAAGMSPRVETPGPTNHEATISAKSAS